MKKCVFAVCAAVFAACAPAAHAVESGSQWEMTSETMFSLISQGFELKSTVIFEGSSSMILRHYLQKGKSLYVCSEMAADDADTCSKLTVPTKSS